MPREGQPVPAHVGPVPRDIFRRWYGLSRAAWEEEARSGFPVLSQVRGRMMAINVGLLKGLPTEERVRLALTLKKRPRSWLATLAGDVATAEEARFIEGFERRARWIFAEELSALPREKTQRPDRRKLRKGVLPELTRQLGKPDFSRSGRSAPVFWTEVGGGWMLETTVDFGGSDRQVEYDFALGPAQAYRRTVEGLSWIGESENRLDCVVSGEEDQAAHVIGICVSKFLGYLPKLVEGLPSASVPPIVH